jgi:hypothetical protein
MTKEYKEYYEYQTITVDSEHFNNMLMFLDESVKKSRGYNYWGFWMFYLWPHSGERDNRWFCSEFISTALMKAGLEIKYDPCKMTPGKIHQIVQSMSHTEEIPLDIVVY